MVAAIAALAAVALIVANLAGLVLLHDYLLGRIDQQLTTSVRVYERGPGATDPDLPPPRPRFIQELGPDLRIYLYSPSGGLVRSSVDGNAGTGPALHGFDGVNRHSNAVPYTVADSHGGDDWRVIAATRSDGGVAAIAVSLRQVNGTAARLGGIDAGVTLLMLLLLAAAGASVVRLGLAPLTHMQTTAEQIAGGDLTRRVESTDPHTEAGRLGIALNTMLGQIEGALAARTASEQRLRQFLADASHELRTPLTSIRGFAELYRRGGARPGAELDEAMSRIEAEAARMALLVGDLMLLARMDEERPLDRHPVDLLEVAADAVRDAHARVPQRSVRLDPPERPPVVDGDEPRLRQVVTNLVANAMQHTPAGTPITIRVGTGPVPDGDAPVAAVGEPPAPGTAVALLEVVDAGPGMDSGQAARVFERLYRADASRTRAAGGAGLGLAIVAAIVSAHRGRVELRTAPGAGAAFRVILPATGPGDAEPPTIDLAALPAESAAAESEAAESGALADSMA
jgi:two-component system, OmpR family, sensor kinase